MAVRLPPAEPVTRGPQNHWFGYYGKSPWDRSGRYMLATRSASSDRAATPEDRVEIGVVDLKRRREFAPIGESAAWNWQQGAMAQWMGTAAGTEIIYNNREGNHFVSVVHDMRRGASRTLPRPVFAVSADGRYALTLNYSRLADCVPGYGYGGVMDPWVDDAAPADDGIWRMDLQTGDSQLVLSLRQLVDHEHTRCMDGAKHWVNHIRFNPDGSRVAFLHRWSDTPGRTRHHRMVTARPEGTDLQVVCDYQLVSHYDWLDNDWVLTWARQMDMGDRFYLFNVLTGRREVVGYGSLDEDGHCSYSPNRQWIVTDTCPDEESMRALILYCPAADIRYDLGRFFADPQLAGEYSCDLHPRWSRDGKQICFDSTHEGSRQMYVVDVARIVA